MHDGVKAFVPWDGELEELYKSHYGAVNVNVLGLDVRAATRILEDYQKRFGH